MGAIMAEAEEDVVTKAWLALFDAELVEGYGIGIADTGYSEEELYERWGGWPPSVAIDKYAAKYDLMPKSALAFC